MEPTDTEPKQLHDEAVAIGTSGRWDAVNRVMHEMAEDPKRRGVWSLRVHAPLCTAIFSEYLALRKAFDAGKEDDLSLLAWHARNLLEFSVWASYCAASDENTGRFYADAGRDGLDLLRSLGNWGEKRDDDPEWAAQFAVAKGALVASAEEKGLGSLDDPYVKVRDAAKECGLQEHFAVTYKFLSKFAHPTALVLLGNLDSKKQQVREAIYGTGCVCFAGAFSATEPCFILRPTEST